MFVCCTERHNKLKTVKAMTRWQICTTTTMCWCTKNCSTTPTGWSYSEETSLHLFLTNSEAFSSTEECWCPSQISVMNIFNSFQHMCLSIIHTMLISLILFLQRSPPALRRQCPWFTSWRSRTNWAATAASARRPSTLKFHWEEKTSPWASGPHRAPLCCSTSTLSSRSTWRCSSTNMVRSHKRHVSTRPGTLSTRNHLFQRFQTDSLEIFNNQISIWSSLC